MGVPKKELWELVHSLSESEIQKFYDRSFQYKRGRYTNYVILFDAILEQDEFDQEKLKQDLSAHEFIKQLHRVKNYLYHKILDFIREAHRNEETELQGTLEKIKLLFEKRLYSHLPKFLTKAAKLASEMEDFQAHLKILHFKRELLKVDKDWIYFSNEIQKVMRQERELILKSSEKHSLILIKDFVLGGTKVKPEDYGLNSTSIQEYLDRKDLNSNTALVYQLQIKFHLALQRGKYSDCILHTDRIVETFKTNPGLIQDYSHFRGFVMAVYYGCLFRIELNRVQEADSFINQMKDFAQAHAREPVLFFENHLLYELEAGRVTLSFERFEMAVSDWNNLSPKLARKISNATEIEINHLIGKGFIIFGQPKKALPFIISNKDKRNSSSRPDLTRFAWVLFIIAHYELSNYDVLERTIRSANKSLGKQKKLSGILAEVLNLFKRTINLASESDKKQSFQEFLDRIQSPDSLNSFEKFNNYFSIKNWLNAQVQNKPLLDIIRDSNS